MGTIAGDNFVRENLVGETGTKYQGDIYRRERREHLGVGAGSKAAKTRVALCSFWGALVHAYCAAFAILGSRRTVQFWMGCSRAVRVSLSDALEKPAGGRDPGFKIGTMDFPRGWICIAADLGDWPT